MFSEHLVVIVILYFPRKKKRKKEKKDKNCVGGGEENDCRWPFRLAQSRDPHTSLFGGPSVQRRFAVVDGQGRHEPRQGAAGIDQFWHRRLPGRARAGRQRPPGRPTAPA